MLQLHLRHGFYNIKIKHSVKLILDLSVGTDIHNFRDGAMQYFGAGEQKREYITPSSQIADGLCKLMNDMLTKL